MFAFDYVVSGSSVPDEPSTLVGELSGLEAELRIENTGGGLHGMFSSIVSIGDGPASSGTLTVTGAGTLFDSGEMLVGREGAGTFVVESGASADTTGAVSMATVTDSVGHVTLTGAGSQWTTTGSAFDRG